MGRTCGIHLLSCFHCLLTLSHWRCCLRHGKVLKGQGIDGSVFAGWVRTRTLVLLWQPVSSRFIDLYIRCSCCV
ncbi:hypothetical protein B0I35DRAFT_211467 [Stachybotrys elegans]|uniref:Secreted protein n=1 Tax=Stachybotrys elegans TaxID=80388 RepID=A0A8K0WSX7_9HYPO|nr:hypothetical protein B0I35DRAFT_211467 [Stachybotrys elegans]